MASYIATVTFPDGHTLYTWFSSVSFNALDILVAATPAERAWMETGDRESDRFEAHHRHQFGMSAGERGQAIRDSLGIGSLQSLGDAVAASYPDEVEDAVVTVPCDVTWKSRANRRLLVLVGALEPPQVFRCCVRAEAARYSSGCAFGRLR